MNIEPSCSDEQLVRLAQQGYSEACERLLQRYNHKVKHIISFQVSDQSHAHDLAQEVLFKVYKHLELFNGECLFSTWLYRIVKNTLKNHFRALTLRLDLENRYADEYYYTLSHSPEYHLINTEFIAQIDNAIARLSEELRMCYGMHIVEGHTYEDIAKEMQCPVGTVRSRIFRARKLLTVYIGKNTHPH